MGEIYDTTLKPDLALKVLPAAFLGWQPATRISSRGSFSAMADSGGRYCQQTGALSWDWNGAALQNTGSAPEHTAPPAQEMGSTDFPNQWIPSEETQEGTAANCVISRITIREKY
jgi:hypothetical protein